MTRGSAAADRRMRQTTRSTGAEQGRRLRILQGDPPRRGASPWIEHLAGCS